MVPVVATAPVVVGEAEVLVVDEPAIVVEVALLNTRCQKCSQPDRADRIECLSTGEAPVEFDLRRLPAGISDQRCEGPIEIVESLHLDESCNERLAAVPPEP